jgi:hypothetical protein
MFIDFQMRNMYCAELKTRNTKCEVMAVMSIISNIPIFLSFKNCTKLTYIKRGEVVLRYSVLVAVNI